MSVSSRQPSGRLKLPDDVQRQASDFDEAVNAPASVLDGVLMLVLPFACCLLPFGLAGLSFIAAKIGNWTAVPRYFLAGGTLIALVFAWRRIYRPKAACESEEHCCLPPSRLGQKVVFWVMAAAAMHVVFPSLP